MIMDRPKVFLIINVLRLYLVMGPLILFGIYVLFDSLIKRDNMKSEKKIFHNKKDPALWKEEEIRHYLS